MRNEIGKPKIRTRSQHMHPLRKPPSSQPFSPGCQSPAPAQRSSRFLSSKGSTTKATKATKASPAPLQQSQKGAAVRPIAGRTTIVVGVKKFDAGHKSRGGAIARGHVRGACQKPFKRLHLGQLVAASRVGF
jgi:hypothetical protein